MQRDKHTDKAEYDFSQWPEMLRVIHEDGYGVDFIYKLFVDKFWDLEFKGKNDLNDLHAEIAKSGFMAGLRIGYSIAYHLALPFERFKKEAEIAGIEEFDFLKNLIQIQEDSEDVRG